MRATEELIKGENMKFGSSVRGEGGGGRWRAEKKNYAKRIFFCFVVR